MSKHKQDKRVVRLQAENALLKKAIENAQAPDSKLKIPEWVAFALDFLKLVAIVLGLDLFGLSGSISSYYIEKREEEIERLIDAKLESFSLQSQKDRILRKIAERP